MERIFQDMLDRPIKILAVGDFHIGSTTAILHPNAKSFDGVIHSPQPQNRMQKWLWKNFLSDLTEVGKVDLIINTGDNIDGAQIKMFGRTLVDPDEGIQTLWAEEINSTMIEIVKPKVFILVPGTIYHVRSTTNNCADYEIVKKLQKKYQNVSFIYSDNVTVKIGRLIWNIAHPYPSVEYSSHPAEKLVKQHAVEHYMNNSPRIDVFLRGHCHVFNFLRYRGGAYVITTPCQQPTSAYGRERAYLTVRRPDVGVLEITQVGESIIPRPLLHKWRD